MLIIPESRQYGNHGTKPYDGSKQTTEPVSYL